VFLEGRSGHTIWKYSEEITARIDARCAEIDESHLFARKLWCGSFRRTAYAAVDLLSEQEPLKEDGIQQNYANMGAQAKVETFSPGISQ